MFVLLALLRIGIVFWLYSTIETWVTVRLGLDYYATQLLTSIIVAVVTFMLPSFAWYLLLGKGKAWGTVAMIGGQALVFLLVYTVGQDVYFDRLTGKPLRFYVDTPDGRQFSFTPGYHPKYGIEYKPYTREVANNPTSVPKSEAKEIPRPQQKEATAITENKGNRGELNLTHNVSITRNQAGNKLKNGVLIYEGNDPYIRVMILQNESLSDTLNSEKTSWMLSDTASGETWVTLKTINIENREENLWLPHGIHKIRVVHPAVKNRGKGWLRREEKFFIITFTINEMLEDHYYEGKKISWIVKFDDHRSSTSASGPILVNR